MKETKFIEQNKDKWIRFEKAYADAGNPEELGDLYLDITDDLSYAQTFYKRRTVRAYLNQLAQKVFISVHKQKKDSFKKIFTVWKTSLPIEIYRSRKNLTIALIAFFIYAMIGVLTTEFNHDFPRIVMGDAYVSMTLENIKNGNPLGVYQTDDQTSMFLMITTNNLKVTFMMFAAGLFFTVGSHLLLFSNGIMLGAFQYFFKLKGLLTVSFLGIWIHGAFEISSMVIAAGAGITAGNGWLFPGSFSRTEAFQASVKSGLKIMLSLIPFIITAGFLESYVTHNYQSLSDWSKWMIILFSFSFIIFVYVIYPIYVARKHPELIEKNDIRVISSKKIIPLHKIRDLGALLTDSFVLYRQKIGQIFKILLLSLSPLLLFILWFQNKGHAADMLVQHEFDWIEQLRIIFGYQFNNEISIFYDLITVFLWSWIIAYVFTVCFFFATHQEKFSRNTLFQFVKKKIVMTWLGNSLLFAVVFILPWYFLIWAIFLFIPFLFLQPAVIALHNESFWKKFTSSFSFGAKNYGNIMLNLLLTLFLVTILVQPIAFLFSQHSWGDEPMVSDLLDMLAKFVKRIASIYTDQPLFWSNLARQIVYLLAIFLILPFIAFTIVLMYYSELEKREGVSLKEDFKKFGKRSRLKENAKELD